MNLLISRHGQSKKDVNARGFLRILGGSYDYDMGLTEKGRAQAEKLGRLLKNEKLDAVYSSNLSRAKETAEIAMNVYGGGLKINADERLNERHFGDLSGKFSDEMILNPEVMNCLNQKKLEDYLGVPNKSESLRSYLKRVLYEVDAPNIEATTIITINSRFYGFKAESADDIKKRLNDFENYLLKQHNPDDNIAVFCHGDVMRCWMNKVEEEQKRYSLETVEKVKAIPSKGVYREVPDCSLFKIALG